MIYESRMKKEVLAFEVHDGVEGEAESEVGGEDVIKKVGEAEANVCTQVLKVLMVRKRPFVHDKAKELKKQPMSNQSSHLDIISTQCIKSL